MIKKLILLSCLVLVPTFSFADPLMQQHKAVIAKKHAVAVSSCPPFHDTTYVALAWDGNHDSGVDIACNAAGAEVDFDDTAADIQSTGCEDGNCLKADALGEYMYYTQTAGLYADFTASQTICMRIYMSSVSVFDNDLVGTFRFQDTVDDDFWIGIVRTSDLQRTVWDPETNANDSRNGSPGVWGAWHTIAFSQDIGDTGALSVNPGDQDPWINGWEDDAADAVAAMDQNATDIYVGTYSNSDFATFSPTNDATEYYLIDKFAIVDFYRFNCSTLTGF